LGVNFPLTRQSNQVVTTQFGVHVRQRSKGIEELRNQLPFSRGRSNHGCTLSLSLYSEYSNSIKYSTKTQYLLRSE
jgi:hypothetical protein